MPNANAKGPGNTLIPGPRLIDGSDILSILSGGTNFSGISLTSSAAVPGLFAESTTNAIVAHAGGGQTNATVLYSEVNRVTTVATAGDSIALPVSQSGLTIMVVNNGTNPMQVYGNPATTDTIDGVASGTGVSQMPGSTVFYTCAVAGLWQSEGIATGYYGSFQTESYADGLSANAAGTQLAGTPITTMLSGFGTVGGAGYSATLPPSAPGLVLTIINETATSMNVFPAAGEKINSGAANAAVAVTNAAPTIFYCLTAGNWWTK